MISAMTLALCLFPDLGLSTVATSASMAKIPPSTILLCLTFEEVSGPRPECSVTITPAGKVHLQPGLPLDEAARKFWQAVELYRPCEKEKK